MDAKYLEMNIERADVSVRPRIRVERKIAGAFVEDAVRFGYKLDVWADHERIVPPTDNEARIYKGLFDVDEATVNVYDGDTKEAVSFVFFVFGNEGYDVISDYGTNLDTKALATYVKGDLLKRANAIADHAEKTGER